MQYVVGLDLGMAGDFSALACLRYTPPESPEMLAEEATRYGQVLATGKLMQIGRSERPQTLPRKQNQYELPTLKRWALGTSYTQVAKDVARYLWQPDLQGATLVIDETGVGVGVIEIVARELLEAQVPSSLIKICITGGSVVSHVGLRKWNVSKRVLISYLSAVVHGGRLKVAKDLPEAEVLVKEMEVFKSKINFATGHESLEHWRSSDHDDLTLATALAIFWAEHPRPKAGAI